MEEHSREWEEHAQRSSSSSTELSNTNTIIQGLCLVFFVFKSKPCSLFTYPTLLLVSGTQWMFNKYQVIWSKTVQFCNLCAILQFAKAKYVFFHSEKTDRAYIPKTRAWQKHSKSMQLTTQSSKQKHKNIFIKILFALKDM